MSDVQLLPPDGRTKSPVADVNGNIWCCAECGLSAATASFNVPLHKPTCKGMPRYSPIARTRFTATTNPTEQDGAA